MVEMVKQADSCEPLGISTMEFRTDPWNNVFTVEFDKRYIPRFNKAWINLRTRSQKIVPHGYRKPQRAQKASIEDLEAWLATHTRGVPFRNPYWDPAIFEWRPEDRVVKVNAQGVPLVHVPRTFPDADAKYRHYRQVEASRWTDDYAGGEEDAAMETDDEDDM